MATYYVGVGGSDSNNGTSYALRKLTINAVEDLPVVAGDTVYVAPGVYREMLTCDVSGSSGSPITYIADVSGAVTDGIGGIVRITGSDNDTTASRASCITATSRNYRTFRGFTLDTCTSHQISLVTACGNWIIEDCYLPGTGAASALAISVAGTGTTNTIRRCIFWGARGIAITFTHGSVVDNAAHVVENCYFIACRLNGISSVRVGGITLNHCNFIGCNVAFVISTAITVGQTITVNNSIFAWNTTALSGTLSGEIVENYNAFWGNATDRTNTATGANSNAFPPLFLPPTLLSGFIYPWNPLDLSQWSAIRRIAGTSMASTNIYGTGRPATDSKKSWGATQYADRDRETTTTRTGGVSVKLADAGTHQMFVPTTAVSTVFSCYVRWETDYTGTKPSITIKQPGQSNTTVVATGSAGAWELVTTTLTPAANPGYVVVVFASSNTATSGSYATYVDDFTVS